jgi:hypothetical protein
MQRPSRFANDKYILVINELILPGAISRPEEC